MITKIQIYFVIWTCTFCYSSKYILWMTTILCFLMNIFNDLDKYIFLYSSKYILWFKKNILSLGHFVIRTIIFCELNKYILCLGKTYCEIWTNTMWNLDHYIFRSWPASDWPGKQKCKNFFAQNFCCPNLDDWPLYSRVEKQRYLVKVWLWSVRFAIKWFDKIRKWLGPAIGGYFWRSWRVLPYGAL